MPGQRPQPALGDLRGLGDGALERVGDPGGRDQGAGAGRVDVQPQPLPGRDGAQHLGCRLHPEPVLAPGPGRALAEAVHQHPEPGERLLTGHLLLDDRRHQGLHHQPAATEPRVRVPTPGLGQHGMSRLETRSSRRCAPSRSGTEESAQSAPGPQASATTRRRSAAARSRAWPGLRVSGCRARCDPPASTAERRVTAAASVLPQHRADRARPVGSPDPTAARLGRHGASVDLAAADLEHVLVWAP